MNSPQANGHPSTPPSSDPAAPAQPTTLPTAPDLPQTSLTDTGDTKRPRDARLIHLVLSSLGIHSYQERVPLQLLDFAYRYTSSVLSDSLRLSSEGYQGSGGGAGAGGGKKAAGGDGDSSITVTALRQAIASRTGYHFQAGGALPKEFMLEQALERNRVQLPKVERGYGVLLPPEKYCLTGTGFGLREEWDSEEDEEEEVELENGVAGAAEDERMGDEDGDVGEDEDEEGAGRMEDVFGEDDDAGGDTKMED